MDEDALVDRMQLPPEVARMLDEQERTDDAIRRSTARTGTCPECGDLQSLLALYASARWYDEPHEEPMPLLTPEGEDAALLEACFRVADRAAASALLQAVAVPSGDGFVEVVATRDGPWPRANLWWTADGDLAIACTGDRFAYWRALFDHAFPAIRFAMSSSEATTARGIRSRIASPFTAPVPGAAPPEPSVRQALDELVRREEARWVDEPAWLLEGVVPRDAWTHARGRERLGRLLDEATAGPSGTYGVVAAFDPDRVRALLDR